MTTDLSIDILNKELTRVLMAIEQYESYVLDAKKRMAEDALYIQEMEERARGIEASIERLRVGL